MVIAMYWFVNVKPHNQADVESNVLPTEPRASIFTVAQVEELKRLKAYFPYRIVWGAVSVNNEFVCMASSDRRELNKYLRKQDWLVATLG